MARKQAGKKKPTNKEFRQRFPARDSAAIRALAANVRRLRKARDWSQDQLAGELGIEQNAVSLLENARSNPTILVVEQIARIFDIGISELLDAPRRKEG
ncbi:helix-turn-helix domain-containing protein [Bradyrhizobium yuanmingense]|uniref:helix-turn-helix domain-containing protein n=1 Tax=Bradyrhizobium yuanmingense TaxID=108015 RepID=UPI0023B8F940|nr:helix-turn-helix transcriptional regulator [Bradyrhizobium yuanmingense]MDF0498165.1 helix-turn-helix transcriptional regulator [Bradyrhizobium yuanmingense]